MEGLTLLRDRVDRLDESAEAVNGGLFFRIVVVEVGVACGHGDEIILRFRAELASPEVHNAILEAHEIGVGVELVVQVRVMQFVAQGV